MPLHDNIWMPFGAGELASLAEAAIGTLIFRFEGSAVMLGSRPQGPGNAPTRFAVDLDTFEATKVDATLERDMIGVGYSSDFVVDPRSAYLARPDHYEVGDLIMNGAFIALITSYQGDTMSVGLRAAMSTETLVGFHAWSMAVAGQPLYTKLDL